MRDDALTFSMPNWRATRWLVDPGVDAPDDIRRALVASLFGTLPIFVGGILNSILIAAIVTSRVPHTAFLIWLGFEVAICLIRLVVLIVSFRNARRGLPTPTDLYLLLGVAWAASVGYGAFISILSADWLAATLACMSAAAMVGGICFRNFGAPRLSAVMTALSLGPTCIAAPLAAEPALLITFIQIPFYLFSMRMAAYKLNALLIATMQAERESGHLARHDSLTGLTNRAGLMRAFEEAAERRFALLYIDLDGFKAVNDVYGHAAGDKLLKAAADRLRRMLRGGDVAARIGGDEFVIVARNVERGQAPAFGERLIRELEAPYDLDGAIVVTIGVSVGVALTPDHGDDVSELLDVADAALYNAKSLGKSRCVVASARSRSAVSGSDRAAPRGLA